jgi:NADPH:quinone reductase-like Zn-dependent oxidoreductase
MKAIVYNKKHSPDKLVYSDVQKPKPTENQILVRVRSVSINAADYRSMKMGMIPKNKIFGAAIAGIVESVGVNTQLFKPGDDVFGDLSDFGFGGLAEYAVAPEKALVLKPDTMSFEEASTLPVSATTALKALRDKGNIQKSQKVLLVGAAGGVGTFAIQLANYYEANITAVCSTRNLEQSKSFGADHIIDYTREDFTKSDERYDLIVAINGNHSLISYKRLLNKTGIYVMVGGALVQVFKSIFFSWLFSMGSRKMRFLSAKSDRKDLEFLAQLFEKGKIKAPIEQYFPLEKTADAMNYLSEGHAKGKVVIKVNDKKK